MKIDNLRAFIEVATTENMTKAAENLFMSQQNLSFIIKNMEKKLGVTLFNREENKRIFLTHDGKDFLLVAEKMVDLYDDYILQRKVLTPENVIILYTTPALAENIMAVQSQLSDENIYLSIHRRNYDELITLLQQKVTGLVLCPVYSGYSPSVMAEENLNCLRKVEKSLLTVAHETSPAVTTYANKDNSNIEKYISIVDTYFAGIDLEKVFVSSNINLTKKLMKRKGFLYDTTYSLYAKFFGNEPGWVIVNYKEENLEYRLYISDDMEWTDIKVRKFLDKINEI